MSQTLLEGMTIPSYHCNGCGHDEPEKKVNQPAQHLHYTIRSVVIECKGCGKQKIVQVIP